MGNGSTESQLTFEDPETQSCTSETINIYHFVGYIIYIYMHPPLSQFATFIRSAPSTRDDETRLGLAYLARPRATAGTPQWVLPCVQPGRTQDQCGKRDVM